MIMSTCCYLDDWVCSFRRSTVRFCSEYLPLHSNRKIHWTYYGSPLSGHQNIMVSKAAVAHLNVPAQKKAQEMLSSEMLSTPYVVKHIERTRLLLFIVDILQC